MNPADTAGPPDVSVVMVNWNGLAVTVAALDSLREHTRGIAYEVHLIDNGSTKDASRDVLPRRYPWVRFTANPDNRGFTRANNQGIREARGRYVLLLNNDTVQTENALGEAVAYVDAHPDVGALGIMHRNNDPGRTFQPSFFDFPTPRGDLLGLFRRPRPLPPPAVVERDVDWACGSFLMVRRACLDRVGLLDEAFFAYDEDIDWCRRAWRAGWKVRFWPGVSLVHLGSGSALHLRDKTGLMFRSHLTYLRKHHGRAAAAAFYLGMGLKLAGATGKQAARWAAGRATRADVRQRWDRFRAFTAVPRLSSPDYET